MDDVLTNDDAEGLAEHAPATGFGELSRTAAWGIGSRITEWMCQSRVAARVSAMRKLAELYAAQTGLIFPGRATQGRDVAQVTPRGGAELIRAKTKCGE